MRVLKIAEGTSVDGPGLRTSIYFAGCGHHCEGCHNRLSWDAQGGREMSLDDLLAVIIENEAPVTFSGGDPLLQATELRQLIKRLKEQCPEQNIWCYTGYTWDEIIASPELLSTVEQVDVVVDGRFVLGERDTSLLFRGSANQRLIDVRATLGSDKNDEPVLFDV